MLDTFVELRETEDPHPSGSERSERDGTWKGQRLVVSRKKWTIERRSYRRDGIFIDRIFLCDRSSVWVFLESQPVISARNPNLQRYKYSSSFAEGFRRLFSYVRTWFWKVAIISRIFLDLALDCSRTLLPTCCRSNFALELAHAGCGTRNIHGAFVFLPVLFLLCLLRRLPRSKNLLFSPFSERILSWWQGCDELLRIVEIRFHGVSSSKVLGRDFNGKANALIARRFELDSLINGRI